MTFGNKMLRPNNSEDINAPLYDINTAENNRTQPQNPVYDNDGFDFVVISYGKSGVNAFNKSGVLNVASEVYTDTLVQTTTGSSGLISFYNFNKGNYENPGANTLFLMPDSSLIYENYNQAFNYLIDLDLRTIAQLIVQDSVQPLDNKVTFSILDSVTSGTTETRTYYSKAFDKIILKSDGALSEVIGSYCIKSIINNPNELLEWISSGKFESPSESIANYIAYDLVMGEQPKKEKAELFKKIKSDALNKSTSKFSIKFIDQINKEFELLFEE
jgi:hypothetical protein